MHSRLDIGLAGRSGRTCSGQRRRDKGINRPRAASVPCHAPVCSPTSLVVGDKPCEQCISESPNQCFPTGTLFHVAMNPLNEPHPQGGTKHHDRRRAQVIMGGALFGMGFGCGFSAISKELVARLLLTALKEAPGLLQCIGRCCRTVVRTTEKSLRRTKWSPAAPWPPGTHTPDGKH